MDCQQAFGKAKWIMSTDEKKQFFILRAHFFVDNVKQATLRVLGLGFFHCYINGEKVGNELFLPLNSEYEPRENYPQNEQLSGFHTYVPEYDVTHLLKDGDNVICLHVGGGWYTYVKGSEKSDFGCAKAIWYLFGEDKNGAFAFGSSEKDKLGESFIGSYHLTLVEEQDYTRASDKALTAAFDDSLWANACLAKPLKTEYLFSDCPPDRVQECLQPTVISRTEDCVVYDCGKNVSGYPVLRLRAKRGGQVRVEYSEGITQEGFLDEFYAHKQRSRYISDGESKTVQPLFTWFGFRYFSVQGDAIVERVDVVYSDVEKTSHFQSDNEDLNWLHDAYVQTQLTNLHAGIPSDCPHIERRGYTGDGQLTCKAAMRIFDGKAFYKKWMRDIADGQDKKTGHVQYTAPYIRSGGGPGGWGISIVEVPYRYYWEYGDSLVLQTYYPQMHRYLGFLESHSKNDLVISDVEGVWCLGEWCTAQETKLPAPFINTYFYIKALQRVAEIAKIIEKTADISAMQATIERKKCALATFMDENGDFCKGQQGANVFALDVGVGTAKTYENIVTHYRDLGEFDTGMFGTYVLLGLLFKRGNGELATKLLTSDGVHSFTEMKRRGATTIWEYWPDSFKPVRSQNHPMFGACVAYFYDYYLGIRAKNGTPAYTELQIEPVLVDEINALSGYRQLPLGKVCVAYRKRKDGVTFTVEVPKGQRASFIFNGKRTCLQEGKNTLDFPKTMV